MYKFIYSIIVYKISAKDSLSDIRTCESCIKYGPDTTWYQFKNIESEEYYCGIIDRDKHGNTDMTDSDYYKTLFEKSPEFFIDSPETLHEKLRLRNYDSAKFSLNIELEKMPVDLYFLMDFTSSMIPIIEPLSRAINMIIEEIVDPLDFLAASEVNVGYGAFTDRPTPPFASSNGQKNYIFKNLMPIQKSNGVDYYQEIVNQYNKYSRISSDTPEAAFDAVINAISCSEVGWNKQNQKIIIILTDATSHTAGVGKMAALPTGNAESSCYKDAPLSRDAPSMFQVRKILDESKTSLMFVTLDYEQTNDFYQNAVEFLNRGSFGIHQHIKGCKLAKDASGETFCSWTVESLSETRQIKAVSDKIVSSYKKMMQNAFLTIHAPNNLSTTVEYSSCPESCLGKENCCDLSYVQGKKTTVSYQISVESVGNLCENDKELKIEIPGRIRTFVLDISSICTCEDFPSTEPDQCSNSLHTCLSGTSICSKNGECKCGQCFCNQDNYMGKFCECDISSCPVCLNGNCICTKDGPTCACDPGFTGETCECKQSTVKCEKCSNHGVKICPNGGSEKCDCDSESKNGTLLWSFFGDCCQNFKIHNCDQISKYYSTQMSEKTAKLWSAF